MKIKQAIFFGFSLAISSVQAFATTLPELVQHEIDARDRALTEPNPALTGQPVGGQAPVQIIGKLNSGSTAPAPNPAPAPAKPSDKTGGYTLMGIFYVGSAYQAEILTKDGLDFFVPLGEMLDDHWTFYKADSRHAYFSQVSVPAKLIKGKKCSKSGKDCRSVVVKTIPAKLAYMTLPLRGGVVINMKDESAAQNNADPQTSSRTAQQ